MKSNNFIPKSSSKIVNFYRNIFGYEMALNRYLRIIYIKKELEKLKNLKILDLGCGDCQFTSLLQNEGNEITAIDISKIFPINYQVSNINFVLADGNHLPFKDQYFDFVFCSDVLEHVDNYQGFIEEIERVLNYKGRCLVSTVDGMWQSPVHLRERIKNLPYSLSNLIMGTQFNKSDLCLNIDFLGHVNFGITPDILITQFQCKNFEVIQKKYYCGVIGSMIMEIFFTFNLTIRFFIFPFLRIMLYFDKLCPKPKFWQYYLLLEKIIKIDTNFFPVEKPYTVDEDISTNNKIKVDLTQIIFSLRKYFSIIESVVLVGGFGRGEGSVLKENTKIQPVNDYDIVIISKSQIDSVELGNLSKKIAENIGIRLVDLINIRTVDFKTLPYTMFNYDLKYGGLVIFGNPYILKEIPEMDPSRMPILEGKILLFNRLICLLECFSYDFFKREPNTEEKFFLVNQCNKVIFACCDAMLILRGEYHISYRQKNEKFQYTYPKKTEAIGLIKKATDFKLKPTKEISINAIDFWFTTKKFYFETLLSYLNRTFIVSKEFADFEDFGEFYQNISFNNPKSNLELTEIFLLLAVNINGIDTHFLKKAAEQMINIAGSNNIIADEWEKNRKLCVKLWFEINH